MVVLKSFNSIVLAPLVFTTFSALAGIVVIFLTEKRCAVRQDEDGTYHPQELSD